MVPNSRDNIFLVWLHGKKLRCLKSHIFEGFKSSYLAITDSYRLLDEICTCPFFIFMVLLSKMMLNICNVVKVGVFVTNTVWYLSRLVGYKYRGIKRVCCRLLAWWLDKETENGGLIFLGKGWGVLGLLNVCIVDFIYNIRVWGVIMNWCVCDWVPPPDSLTVGQNWNSKLPPLY